MTSGPEPDFTAQVRTILEPLEQAIDESRELRREDEEFLAAKRARGLDADTKALFDQAARSPEAPESLRRLARRVEAGQLTWDDVFAHRAGPDGEDFLRHALTTAAEHADDLDVSKVTVPEEAVAHGEPPVEVADDLDQTLTEAREAHDRLWREELLPEVEADEPPPAPGPNDGITPA